MSSQNEETSEEAFSKKTEYQTRNSNGELKFFYMFDVAFDHAKKDPSVWKISFEKDGKYYRWVRYTEHNRTVWKNEPLIVLYGTVENKTIESLTEFDFFKRFSERKNLIRLFTLL